RTPWLSLEGYTIYTVKECELTFKSRNKEFTYYDCKTTKACNEKKLELPKFQAQIISLHSVLWDINMGSGPVSTC
ncbi:hypothetical protein M8C21_011531, partial [Ambrosia artemisiifolia]